jgi:hypothetical protein
MSGLAMAHAREMAGAEPRVADLPTRARRQRAQQGRAGQVACLMAVAEGHA